MLRPQSVCRGSVLGLRQLLKAVRTRIDRLAISVPILRSGESEYMNGRKRNKPLMVLSFSFRTVVRATSVKANSQLLSNWWIWGKEQTSAQRSHYLVPGFSQQMDRKPGKSRFAPIWIQSSDAGERWHPHEAKRTAALGTGGGGKKALVCVSSPHAHTTTTAATTATAMVT